MKKGQLGHKISFVAAIMYVAVCGLGTKACQQDYDLGAQTEGISSSASASASPTVSPSASPSDTESATPTSTPTPTPSPTATPSELPRSANGMDLSALEKLSEAGTGAATTGNSSTKPTNWLGKSYSDEAVAGVFTDSDNDGYSDQLESDSGSDPAASNSIPQATPCTRIESRFHGVDDDEDGVANAEEQRRGMDSLSADSDSDGVKDGAELLSESDPLDPASKAYDSDGDGLSDEYESNAGLNPHNADTDEDRVRDDVELALGLDPHSNESDRDGILDWKELQLGTDPAVNDSVCGR